MLGFLAVVLGALSWGGGKRKNKKQKSKRFFFFCFPPPSPPPPRPHRKTTLLVRVSPAGSGAGVEVRPVHLSAIPGAAGFPAVVLGALSWGGGGKKKKYFFFVLF